MSDNFKVIDWNAEVKKMWGPEWNKPEVSYRFSNGREFELRTEHASIYVTSPKFNG